MTCNSRRKVGLVYDSSMTRHRNEVNPNHPETPERISQTWLALNQEGLIEKCEVVKSHDATYEEILRVHGESHLELLASTTSLPQDDINLVALCYNSVFLNQHSFPASRLAAGSLVALTEAVVTGQISNGMALVRPPGHHAENILCMGFCLLNSVAIAARHTIDKLGLKRVLIVDWDIHHGNGTQKQFYEDDRILYFSLHRYDNGGYFPCSTEADFDCIGSGNGAGYNINVAWNGDSMGDTEYLLAFHHLLIPIATEFSPELVLVSCGFDAGDGDSLGGYHVTPAGYAHMTQQLLGMAGGKVVLALEGGYSISCISNSTCAIVSTLLGDSPMPKLDICEPVSSAVRSIWNTGRVHAEYWKLLSVFTNFDKMEKSRPLASTGGIAVEFSGGNSSIFGRSTPKKDLKDVISKLHLDIDHVDAAPDSSHDKVSYSCESQDRGSHDQQGSHTSSAVAQASPSKMVSPGITLVQKNVVQSLALGGHDAMFAVSPKLWCEHLASHVKSLPSHGVDSSQPCATCGATQEPWICLSCYHVFCGRYVNEHMLVHQDTSGHKIALSMADLSVWCYLCDSYLDNHVLRPAINSAHKSKFGCNIDGSTS